MNAVSPENFISFAEQLANIAGDIIRQSYGKVSDFKVKDDASPVTVVDREVERAIRALIRQMYPEHGIIGEEYESVNEGARFTWVIDPIDGTKSFMIGRPIFGTLITLLDSKEPVLGIIDQPILGERWLGMKGFATQFNNEEVKARKCSDLSKAVFCTTSPNLFEGNDFKVFEKIRKKSQYVVYGGDCYSYGLIARGTVDIVLETGLKIYDFLSLRTIIEGAGGIITDWQGNEITSDSEGKILACGDKQLHAETLELLTK